MADGMKNNLEDLERALPEASGVVFSDARDHALADGQSVLLSEDGQIYEVFPNGDRRLVKETERPVEVEIGRKIEL